MSLCRFERIKHHLHFNDNTILDNNNATYDEAQTDSLFKLKPVLDSILTQFQTFPAPGKIIA